MCRVRRSNDDVSGALARLIQEISKLPGIGEKTAARLAFHMLKGKKEDVLRSPRASASCAKRWAYAAVVSASARSARQRRRRRVCGMCRNVEREEDKICVVEEPADLIAVEKSQEYRGLYHVMHGTISPLDGVGPDALRISELLERLRRRRGSGGDRRHQSDHGRRGDRAVSFEGDQTDGRRGDADRARPAHGR